MVEDGVLRGEASAGRLAPRKVADEVTSRPVC